MAGTIYEVGGVYNGYRYKGGGAKDKRNWEPAEQGDPALYSSYADAEPEPEDPGLLRELGDTGLSVGKGALGLVESVTNIAGADNAVSRGLRTGREYLGSLESQQQQDQRKAHAQRMAEAEATGSMWEEGKAAVTNFLEDPVDYAAEGLGSAGPFVGLRAIGAGAKILGMGARTATATGVGAASGVGSVKGQQYEMVKQAKLAEGYSAEDAEAAAVAAQGYSKDNAVDLLTGGVLGAVAGGTGADTILGGAAKMAGKGLVKRAATGVMTETPFEALQGGQERYAGNQALIREGYDVDPWQGVVGQAVTEGIMSAPVGGGLGAIQGYTPTQVEIDEQTRQRAEAQAAQERALLAAQQQVETQKREAQAKAERDHTRAYYAEQLPFDAWKKERVTQIVNEQITPEIIEGAYQEAFKAAVEQELPPPDRAKFEKDYKSRVGKEVAKDTEALTQEYYATLDNLAATDTDLLGDPTELKPEAVVEPEPAPAEGLTNRRQMDFLGELDRTVQPDYAPVMPVATPGEGAPETTVFTQTPVDDSGLPGALDEAKARAAKGGVVDTPPNTPITPVAPVTSAAPIAAARVAAVENGVSPRAWALFVSKNQLADADNETIAEALRNRAINGMAGYTDAWEAAHKAMTGETIEEFLTRKEADEKASLQASNEARGNRQEGNPETRALRVQEGTQGRGGENALPAVQETQVGALTPAGLSDGQQAVYNTMLAASQNNEFDKFQQSDGKLNYTAIAEASGLKGKQAAYAAVKQTVDKIAAQLGTTRDGMKDFLRSRTAQVRTTEASEADMLGTNPDNFTKTSLQPGAQLDNGDLFGNDEGATAGFGMVDSTGGSQSAVGENVQPTATDLAKPDPVAEKRAAEAMARYAAMQTEALAQPEAAEAAADWDDMRADMAPFAKDLSRQDAYDWLMTYMEWKNGDITEDQLAAEQLDIERRYEADPAKAVGKRDGAGAVGQGEQRALAEGKAPAGETAGSQTEGAETESGQTDPEVDPLIGLLSQLRSLSKEPKHAVIAKDFLARAGRGEDVEAEAGAWVNAVTDDRRGAVRFSKAAEPVNLGQSPADITKWLKGFFASPAFFDRHVSVVPTHGDIPLSVLTGLQLSDDDVIKGVHDPVSKKVYIVAENITDKRDALATFLHEVGVHMGMQNLLGPNNYARLVSQIRKWADSNTGKEGELANRALERITEAEKNNGGAYDKATADDELIAYFVEEAVLDGIDPTALTKESGGLREWFRTLWAAAKVALRKLGINPARLTAKDVVNLAYGAARMETSGSWHGTAADFKRFDHQFMGSGEGAQAFGWGSYLAQKSGIAYGYWKADTRRKAGDLDDNPIRVDGVVYKYSDGSDYAASVHYMAAQWLLYPPTMSGGSVEDNYDMAIEKTVYPDEKAGLALAKRWYQEGKTAVEVKPPRPEGQMIRTDVAVAEDEWLEWDKPLEQQSDKVQKKLTKVFDAVPDIEDRLDGNLEGMTGAELYRIIQRALSDDYIVIESDAIDTALAQGQTDKAASLYLDSIGVKGIRFLDGDSRAKSDVEVKFVGNDNLGRNSNLNEFVQLMVRSNGDFAAAEQAMRDKYGVQKDTPKRDMLSVSISNFLSFAKPSDFRVTPANKTYNLVVFNDKNIQRIYSAPGAKADARKFSIARRETKQMIDELPDHLREPAHWINTKFRELGNAGLRISMFTQDLVDSVESVLPSARDWFESINKRETVRIGHEAEVDDIASRHIDALTPSQFNRTWKLLHDMTRSEKWAYVPTWKKTAVADPEMAARYDALDAAEKAALDAVLKHGNDTLNEVNSVLDQIANDLFDAKLNRATSEASKKKLEEDKGRYLRMYGRKLMLPQGPYAPMRRVGSHIAVGKSQLYLDTEAKAQEGNAKAIDQLADLRTKDEHFMVSFHDGKYEAERQARDYQAAGMTATASAKEVFTSGDQLPFQAFQSLREMATQKDGQHAARLMNMIDELYLTSLADVSARKSELRREGVGGLTPDTMYKAFLSKGKANAHYLSVLKTHRDVADKFSAMRREANASSGTRGDKMDAFNELKKRYEASFDYQPSPLVGKLMNISTYWMLLTKPAYYLYNLTQPFMMTLPYITKRHDYMGAANHLVKAYSDLLKTGKVASLEHFNLDALPVDIRDAMKELRDMGRLDITITQDLGNRIHAGRGNVSKYAARMDNFFRTLAQKTEMANRVVTAATAYRLHLEKTPGDAAGALAYAADVVDKTQGNYSNFNAPRLFNMNSTAKLMTQFKKFQLIQATLLITTVKGIANPHERAANMRALKFMLGHHALLAGAMGLPAINLIAMAFAAAGDDDEPRDLELWMKKNLGDDALGQVLRYGVPALFNANMSSNIGMGQTFSVIPYADVDATRSGYDSMVTSLMGPTIGGLGPQLWGAAGKGIDGDYYGMLSGLLPGFLKSSMKAMGEAVDGTRTGAGDVLVTAEDIAFTDTLMKSLGFRTMKDTTRQLITEKRYEFEGFFRDSVKDIKKNYNEAYRDGDGAKMAELRDRWIKLQQFKREYGFKAQPLAQLIKSPMEQAKRERMTAGGVQYNRGNEEFVTNLVDDTEP